MVLKAPFSTLCYAPSMGGKTEFWIKHLSTLEIFDPKPTHIHLFGHINLNQFNVLVEIWGRDFVDINHVHDLPEFDLVPGSFVLVDELNSSLSGLKSQRKEVILDSVRALYNVKCHHLSLYVSVLCQEIIRTECFRFLSLAQSLCLSTMNAKSENLLRYLYLSPELLQRITSALRMLRNTPEFLIFFHNPPINAGVNHKYAWSYLRHLPHFALAIGEQSKGALALGRSSLHSVVAMESEAAQSALDELTAEPLPKELSGQVYVYIPLDSIKKEEELKADAKPVDAEQLSHSELNRRVLEMLSNVCSHNEFSMFKKFWFYLRLCPFIGINPDGTILYYNGKEINSLSFMRECCKRVPNFGSKQRKPSQILRDCVPFASQLLKNTAFPPHLISNTLLYKLASRDQS